MKLPTAMLGTIGLIALAALSGGGCQPGSSSPAIRPVLKTATGATPSINNIELKGSGAPLPEPVYQAWAENYGQLHKDVKITYQGNSSGNGVKATTRKSVDFAGSDLAMNAAELDAAGGSADIIEIPAVTRAVIVVHSLPGLKQKLKLDGPVLADIFLGKISKWNDPRIVAINNGRLPDLPIQVVRRTDASTATLVFTKYLCEISPAFREQVGAARLVELPGGISAKGSKVPGVLKQTEGAIAYLEIPAVAQNDLDYAELKDKDGGFVGPTPTTISNAGDAMIGAFSGNLLVANLGNAPGERSYPIAFFTYLIIHKDLRYMGDAQKAKALVDYLKWGTTGGGQSLLEARQLDCAPLGPQVQKKIRQALDNIVTGD